MAITRAQAPAHNSLASSGTTLSVTLNGIAAASLIAISGSHDTNSSSTVSVADDLAAAALAINSTTAGGFSQKTALFYYKNYGGGNRTFTMTNSVGALNRGIAVVELAGADTAAPLDGTASGSGTSATPSSSNLTPAPSIDGEYVFGRCEGANQPSFASPASDVFQDTTTFGDTEDYIQPTAAALALTWTQTSALYQALAASFKPAAAATDGPQRRPLSHQQRRAA